MNDEIIALINKVAIKHLRSLSRFQKASYVAMAYVGLRTELEHENLSVVAVEAGYSTSGAYKLMMKWKRLIERGDVTANLLQLETEKYLKRKAKEKKAKEKMALKLQRMAQGKSESEDEIMETTLQTPRYEKVLGFKFSMDEVDRMRDAVRESILFFQDYGKGVRSRTKGEYYAPGENPNEKNDQTRWLTLNMAAIYCGLSRQSIISAAKEGIIAKRVYRRERGTEFCEYKLDDLEKLIKVQ